MPDLCIVGSWFTLFQCIIMDREQAFLFTRYELICGLVVDYCDVLSSCLDYQSDRTHSRQMRRWCNAKFPQMCSHKETKISKSWMAWEWVHFKGLLTQKWTFFHYLVFLLWNTKSDILKNVYTALSKMKVNGFQNNTGPHWLQYLKNPVKVIQVWNDGNDILTWRWQNL